VNCIDTDLLVAILHGKEDARKKMEELDSEGRQATTAVNSFELFYGIYKAEETENSLDKVSTLLGRLDILPLDYEASKKAGELLADLSEEGRPIDFRDALIAGISIANGMPLLTRNKGHFSRIRGLSIEPW
jgi:predicted nucleic acid-binding protein